MKPPGWKRAIPGAAVGFFFRNSQFIYTFYKFCANNFIIPDQTGAYNIHPSPDRLSAGAASRLTTVTASLFCGETLKAYVRSACEEPW